ncbi:MAG: flagellar basal body rod protein FlgC [Alphaproteobacteria bacterium]
MELLKSIMVAASALRAQSSRMRIIAENLANADSVALKAGDKPYQRRISTFKTEFDRALGVQTVRAGKPAVDRSEFPIRYMPGHPAANDKGYVRAPNVNGLIEAMDMRNAQRSYEANLNVITSARRMVQRTLDILRA